MGRECGEEECDVECVVVVVVLGFVGRALALALLPPGEA
jgi:hypothetical protein